MDEQFETRALLGRDALRALLQRADRESALRLALHLGAFALLIAAVVTYGDRPLLALPLTVALAWVWAGLFAPFHECTHQTAFASARGNRLGAWLTGFPFGMSPAVYRTFHFEHHRHTQDPQRDPELSGDPRYADWPTGWRGWLTMASGIGLVRLKLAPLLGFSLRPESEWESFAHWAPMIKDRPGLVRECRLLLAAWVVFLAGALLTFPGGWWLLLAAWLTHVFQGLWIAAEHTGLPHEGSILARTRTVTSNRFVRFWLWNMNYHAEHHAWPGIPWHRLPAAHAEIAGDLESFVPGYAALHGNVIGARGLPSCDRAAAPTGR